MKRNSFVKKKLLCFLLGKLSVNLTVKSVKVDNNKINNRMSLVKVLEKDMNETVYEIKVKKST